MSWIKESNHDKHILYGGLWTAIISLIGLFVGCSLVQTAILSLVSTMGVGGALELKDKLYGSDWDWQDLFATVCGGMVVVAVVLLVHALISSLL